MTESDFRLPDFRMKSSNGSVTWRAPSNIALVKYWGKQQGQLPANPSVSFTLSQCATTTTLSYEKLTQPSDGFSFDLVFECSLSKAFRPKINTFFERVQPYFPFLSDYHFTIQTANTFPHSSGIASSASSMSALALCLMSMEKTGRPDMTDAFFYTKASFTARLGSGSACRSVTGNPVVWGAHPGIEGSSDLYGIPYPHNIHEVFNNYQDTILLVDSGQKQLSSSAGHQLMHDHPFAGKRFEQARDNLSTLKTAFRDGDLESFIRVVESEALTLHAMMMTSRPYFILMQPATLSIIRLLWEFRADTGLHPCFTLDAGANVHLLYPEREKEQILAFINKKLVAYCENERYICDEVGSGAEEL
ncbi:MAG: diphosphomevalonate decarboxylase [Sinomicrobium sp.]|nr:diphosphomevalonate decarboxylase [Sinomicrobium sp.]